MEITTTDLADFGYSERKELARLLEAWNTQGLPEDFSGDEVRPMMNRNSGNVFLTNADYQCAMLNGESLESWYNCSNCGHEGFAEDCILNDDGCNECSPEQEPLADFEQYVSDQTASYDAALYEKIACVHWDEILHVTAESLWLEYERTEDVSTEALDEALDKVCKELQEHELDKELALLDAQGAPTIMTVRELLEHINADRSEEWEDYDASDWREGMEHWTEYKLITEGE